MSELEFKPLNLRLSSPKDLSLEDCKTILEAQNSGLFYLMTNPSRNLGELKLAMFKIGLSWNQGKALEIKKDNKKLLQIIWNQGQAFINPAYPNFSENEKKLVLAALEAIPEDFSIILDNSVIQKDKLKLEDLKWIK